MQEQRWLCCAHGRKADPDAAALRERRPGAAGPCRPLQAAPTSSCRVQTMVTAGPLEATGAPLCTQAPAAASPSPARFLCVLFVRWEKIMTATR
jgi:hypothetical protein